jgi:hypothetical protein
MAKGGEFGVDAIAHFNGGLSQTPRSSRCWRRKSPSSFAPATATGATSSRSILGTLFERTLEELRVSGSLPRKNGS